MIVYLVTNRHRYTIEKYLDGWVPSLWEFIQVLPYERLTHADGLGAATYIFSDLERLSGSIKRAAEQIHRRVSAVPGWKVLNDPSRSLMRYELLRKLRERGINDFSAYRLTETRKPERFPVFLREEGEHRTLTPLLHDQKELDRAIAGVYVRRRGLNRLLMVEFCDTSDDSGIFRKYAAYKVGPRIIPKHVFISREWMIRQSDFVDPDRLREEESYLDTNPHEDELRSLFELAEIDYGRIDYSLSKGGIQVWEVNTNPMIFAPADLVKTERLVFKQKTSQEVARAFEAINGHGTTSAGSARPTSVTEIHSLRTRVGSHPRVRLARKAGRRLRWVFGTFMEKVGGLFWRPVMALVDKTYWR